VASAGLEIVRIRNGSLTEDLIIPSANLLNIVSQSNFLEAPNPVQVIIDSLDNPIGSLPLEEIAIGSSSVVIITDDLTRPTPAHLILPEVLRRLEIAGLNASVITVLIATGTHRPMNEKELEEKLGSEVVANYSVVNHNFEDSDNLVDLGTTSSGIPINLNRLVVDADFVIGIGNIIPHRYCGWSGGAKIIQPGVSGEATTAATHLMITKDEGVRLGNLENKVRHEMELVADKVNLRFIVNTVLNQDQKIVAVVSGDARKAFRHGVSIAEQVCGANYTENADIVIASAHPSDLNLWQAGKALYSADLIVKDGGLIILASPCHEGIGEHGSFGDLVHEDFATINDMIQSGNVEDRVSAAAALAVALVKRRAEVWLVSSGISAEVAMKMGFRKFDSISQALRERLSLRPGSTVSVIKNACEVLPIRNLSVAN
jgi:nickel-dependent lactate racemase